MELITKTGLRTTVVNIRYLPYDIYCGRAGKGQSGTWGNPYTQGSRQQVIERYRDYLLGNQRLMDMVHTLKGKTLGCFCAPRGARLTCNDVPYICHAQVLAEVADHG